MRLIMLSLLMLWPCFSFGGQWNCHILAQLHGLPGYFATTGRDAWAGRAEITCHNTRAHFSEHRNIELRSWNLGSGATQNSEIQLRIQNFKFADLPNLEGYFTMMPFPMQNSTGSFSFIAERYDMTFYVDIHNISGDEFLRSSGMATLIFKQLSEDTP